MPRKPAADAYDAEPAKKAPAKKAPAKKAPAKKAPAKKAPAKKAAKKAPVKKVATRSLSEGNVSVVPNTGTPPPVKRPLPLPKSGIRPRRRPDLREATRDIAPQIPLPNRGDAIDLGFVAGTGSVTGGIGAGATDLCEIAPSGQVALAGDTFAGNAAFQGVWSASMGLHVRPGTLNGVVQFDRSFGVAGTLYADPPPNVPKGSQLPAGTIQVYGIDYALVTQTADLIPLNSRLVRVDPNNPHWPTVPGSLRPADWQWGNQTQISGYQDGDWVYIVADGFARDHSIFLYRAPAANFEDRNTWHAWGVVGGGPGWDWDQFPTAITQDRFGELSLRMIEGMAVLCGFNQDTGNVEAWVAGDVTQVFNGARTIVATQDSVRCNYGGYIVPGSTLDQALILVSQWDTPERYNVREFVVNLNR